MSHMVTLTLAHSLNAAQADRLHAKDAGKDYPTGSKITVPKDDARSIINAGFADGVDPENAEQVRAALESGNAAKPVKDK